MLVAEVRHGRPRATRRTAVGLIPFVELEAEPTIGRTHTVVVGKLLEAEDHNR